MIAEKKITFIGGGNMARALVAGLCATGFPAQNVWVTGRRSEALTSFATDFSVKVGVDNRAAVEAADMVVLCVKPQQLKAVCQEVRDGIHAKRSLVVSMVTGVTLSLFARWLGDSVAVIRAMPNTPSQLGLGVTGFTANANTNQTETTLAEQLLTSMGQAFYFSEESSLDIVTALSGSGPAYVFLFMEALQQAAIALGLDAASATAMTQQTVLGAAHMAIASPKTMAELRHQVTSPGGTTEQALLALQQGGFQGLIATAVEKAWQRAREITAILSEPD